MFSHCEHRTKFPGTQSSELAKHNLLPPFNQHNHDSRGTGASPGDRLSDHMTGIDCFLANTFNKSLRPERKALRSMLCVPIFHCPNRMAHPINKPLSLTLHTQENNGSDNPQHPRAAELFHIMKII